MSPRALLAVLCYATLCVWCVLCTNNSMYVHYRVSYYAKLICISRHCTERLYIAEVKHILCAVNEAVDMPRLVICNLYPARYGLPGTHATEDTVTATLHRQDPDMLAVDMSELHTKLVTAKEGSKLYGRVYHNYNTSGIA